VIIQLRLRIPDDDLETEVFRTCTDDGDGLGMRVAVNEKGIARVFTDPP